MLPFQTATFECKSAGGGIEAVVSTPRLDLQGEVLIPSGLRNRDEYLANPLVYWAHEWAFDPTAEPIGKATRLDVFSDRIESAAEFAPTPKAQNVRALVAGGFVRRTSVGLDPIEHSRDGRTVTVWDLREWSVVPMPANSDAVITGVKSAILWLADQMGSDTAIAPVELVEATEAATLVLEATPSGVVVRDRHRIIARIAPRPLRPRQS